MLDDEDRKKSRRKYTRLPIVVLCDISDPLSGEILGKGCVLNYSRGGLNVGSSAKLAWDSVVNLNVGGLPHKWTLLVHVANSRPVMDGFYSFGMEFQEFNALKRLRTERKFKKLFRTRLS